MSARKRIPRYVPSEDADWPQGHYARVVLDGKPTAVMCCPGCGIKSYMSDHDIAADGTVNPSVGCPKDCGYHEFVVLEDWTP